jgi:alanine dehydrogenase
MKHYDAAAVAAALQPALLIDALEQAFRQETAAPPRQHYLMDGAGTQTLLLMPAWNASPSLGVKLVTVYAGNPERGLPAVNACYVLFDAHSGAVSATLDGNELTLRRTGAASALASRYLSRPDSSRLLMVGTGALAPHLIRSHCSVRPIREVRIWGRHPERAAALAASLADVAPRVEAAADLREAVQRADIISCATLAQEALVHGAWLAPGQHLDLVGAFNARMREADDDALRRAQVFVDTRAGALADAGDVIQALRSGAIREQDLRGDLHDLARGGHRGRSERESITLFKSVGHALEDLAAAQLVVAGGAAPRAG